MKKNKNMSDEEFNNGFNNMMSSALEYEWRKKHKKPIPKRLKRMMDESSDWLCNMSDDDYDRLIH